MGKAVNGEEADRRLRDIVQRLRDGGRAQAFSATYELIDLGLSVQAAWRVIEATLEVARDPQTGATP